jgi:hypothetical protein
MIGGGEQQGSLARRAADGQVSERRSAVRISVPLLTADQLTGSGCDCGSDLDISHGNFVAGTITKLDDGLAIETLPIARCC